LFDRLLKEDDSIDVIFLNERSILFESISQSHICCKFELFKFFNDKTHEFRMKIENITSLYCILHIK